MKHDIKGRVIYLECEDYDVEMIRGKAKRKSVNHRLRKYITPFCEK